MAGTPPQPSATIASGPSNSDPTNPTDPVDQQTSSTTAAQDEADVLSRMFARLDAETPTNLGRSESSPTQATLVGGRAAATDDADSEGTDVGEVWEDAAEDLASDAGDAAVETWTIARLEVRRLRRAPAGGAPRLTRRRRCHRGPLRHAPSLPKAALAMAEELKMRANSEFSPGKAFHQALTTYLSALAAIPDRSVEPDPKGKRRALNSDEGIRIEEVDDAEAARIESGATAEEVQRADLEERCRMLRAVLWSNMAAVYLKLVRPAAGLMSRTHADSSSQCPGPHRARTRRLQSHVRKVGLRPRFQRCAPPAAG
jgi:hypothetical protein